MMLEIFPSAQWATVLSIYDLTAFLDMCFEGLTGEFSTSMKRSIIMVHLASQTMKTQL